LVLSYKIYLVGNGTSKMIDFQQKRKIRKVFYSRFMLVALLVLVLFMAKQVYDIYQKQGLSKEGLTSVLNENSELKNREKMLSSEIERLKTEDGIEEEIRNKFNVVKPGEHLVVIVDDASTSKNETAKENTGWWGSFLGWFK